MFHKTTCHYFYKIYDRAKAFGSSHEQRILSKIEAEMIAFEGVEKVLLKKIAF